MKYDDDTSRYFKEGMVLVDSDDRRKWKSKKSKNL